MTRRQLTDEQWTLIEPYLPIGEYDPYPERLRDQFEGVIWRFRAGAQWREMPGEFGPWPTVYGRFRVWRNAGVFTALLEGLIAEAARQGKADLWRRRSPRSGEPFECEALNSARSAVPD
ncbi:transposase, partial [Streptomyces sp. RB6PN25]